MNKILVQKKINETWSSVEGPIDKLKEISDFLKVEIPGGQFDPLIKRGFKSPYHHFTIVKNGVLYILNGHLQFLSRFGLTEIEPEPKDVSKVQEVLKDIISKFPFKPYDFQVRAIAESILKDKQIALSCTGCLDGDSEIHIIIQNKHEIRTYKEIHKLLDLGIEVHVPGPNGNKKILRKFTKIEKGKLVKYNDGTETRCAITHYMEFDGELRSSAELEVGMTNDSGKQIISIENLPEQEFLDFEIDCPTGLYYQNGITHHNSGKSCIIAILAEYYRRIGKKGLLLVPNINLLTQFHSDIEEYGLSDLYKETRLIGAGFTDRVFDTSLTISTWQSLQEKYTEGLDFNVLDYIIGDEVHRLGAEVPGEIIKKLQDCKIRLGFTGTLPEDQIMKMEILGIFGKPTKYITSRELIDRGLGTPIKINSIMLKYPIEEIRLFNSIVPTGKSKNKFPNQLNYIKEHPRRRVFVNNLTQKLRKTGNTLVIFQHTDHGKDMMIDFYKSLGIEIENKDITGRKSFEFQSKYGVYFLNGEDNAKTRELTRKILEEPIYRLPDGTVVTKDSEFYSDDLEPENAVLFANVALLSTGVNIKRLHNLVMASPYKAYTTVTQSIGRLIRLHKDKKVANVFDIIDDFGIRSPGGPFVNQYKHRLATSYHTEEYPVTEVQYMI